MNSGCIQQPKKDALVLTMGTIFRNCFLQYRCQYSSLVFDNFRHFKTSFLAVKIDKGEHL
jgi:hypothetical protein